MEYLTLPQTDLKVSKIALGCMRIADKSIEEVEELVKTALESGINFFDHAELRLLPPVPELRLQHGVRR